MINFLNQEATIAEVVEEEVDMEEEAVDTTEVEMRITLA